jgi:hypothetical protein
MVSSLGEGVWSKSQTLVLPLILCDTGKGLGLSVPQSVNGDDDVNGDEDRVPITRM